MSDECEKASFDIQHDAIQTIFDQKEKYLIIALTGKVGSGCSSAAEIFQKKYEEMNFSCPTPGDRGFADDTDRGIAIIRRFYKFHCPDFKLIKVSDIIVSFILEDTEAQKRLVKACKLSRKDQEESFWEDCRKEVIKYCNNRGVKDKWPNWEDWVKLDIDEETKRVYNPDAQLLPKGADNDDAKRNYFYITELLPAYARFIRTRLNTQYTDLFQTYGNELRFFGTLNPEKQELYYKNEWSNIQSNPGSPLESTENDIEKMFTIADRINRTIKMLRCPESYNKKQPVAVVIDSMKNIYESNFLKDRYSAYYLFSITRDEQSRVEDVLSRSDKKYTKEDLTNIDFNERPNMAQKKFKKFLSNCQGDNSDEIRFFLSEINKDDYYAIAKAIPNNPIYEACSENKQLRHANLEAGIAADLQNYYLHILSHDPLRVYLYNNGLYPFYLQDVETCIQYADVFLTNNDADERKPALRQSIVRYVSLMLHPGLVPPTPVERCMQIAYTAKVNSGCISRQVGAVVTDSKYRILSLGWNDVPCGQTQCALRTVIDVANGNDPQAYSDYELNCNREFQKYLRQFDFDDKKVNDRLRGIPPSYCFKDFFGHATGDRNPMNARSMHGEEKALLTCDQLQVRGGYLFTTSSPCEMCAKNAKEHEIATIYYIEPYPGISQEHVCNSGDIHNRATYKLFEGAIGRAYTQLYTSIMPYKDELRLLGLPDSFKLSGNNNLGTKSPTQSDSTGKKYMQSDPVGGKLDGSMTSPLTN